MKRGDVRLQLLCAQCACDRVPNQVQAKLVGKDTPAERMTFFRPVLSISIVKLFTREATPTLDHLPGAKHFIDPMKVEPVQVLVVYAPRAAANSRVVTKFRRPLNWQSHQDMQRGE